MATFGDTTQSGGASFPFNADRGICSAFAAPASGTITSVTFTMVDGPANAKGLVYADDGAGHPGSFLGAGSAVAVPSGGGQLTSGSMSVGITNGTTYWLGAVVDNFSGDFSVTATGSNHLSNDNAVTYASPTTWTESSTAVFQFDIYATYTPSGGAFPVGQIML